MKKKILVVFTGAMELGGIERSLLGLLDTIDYEKYEVDLFLYSHRGPLFSLINKNVNLLPEKKELSYLRDSLKKKIFNGTFWAVYYRILEQTKKEGMDKYFSNVLRKAKLSFEKEYDIALGFFQPFDVIKNYVNAKIKVGWIHTDYSAERISKEFLYKSYSGLDYIVAVSESCKKSFDLLLPEYAEKTIVIENILSKNFIVNQALGNVVSSFYKNDDEVLVLSIGRFCFAKNFDNVPEICSLILKEGINIKWYLIGYGLDENIIKEKIKQWHMEDNVILLGKIDNPYPYIKQCDFYIQPSRYEGKSVSVREAQILNKFVVITAYPSADSQVMNGVDGFIVPLDNKECAKMICKVIKDKELQFIIKNRLKNEDFTNEREIFKIYRLMELGDC